jgi:FAD/FMN-containing dehydrogenase
MAHILGEATVSELEGALQGTVIRLGDKDYDEARQVWNGAIDKKPALIVRAASTDDVVKAVRFATSEGLPIAVRGGAHSIAGFSTCDDGMVIDLSLMNSVDVDAKKQVATAGGGTKWGAFDAATQEHGLATPGGLISTTGVGGFALGGGMGHLTRKYGLTTDNLVGVELVTADGSVVHASEADNPELFWALRGGGGNFGVATKFELAVHPVGPTVLGGALFFPGEEAEQVVQGWRDLHKDMPDELNTIMNLTTAPPAPFLPEEWHFKKVAAMLVCWAGDAAEGESYVKPLRALGTPFADLVGPIPYVQLQSLVDALFGPGAANYFTSAFLTELPDEAIATYTDYHRKSADLPVQDELHIHHLGGAVGRVPADATAFTDRSSPYIVNAIARTPEVADLAPQREWARSARDAMAKYGDGRMYVNFTGEGGDDKVKASYPPEIYKRLQKVKDTYDPQNVFRYNQNIKPSK